MIINNMLYLRHLFLKILRSLQMYLYFLSTKQQYHMHILKVVYHTLQYKSRIFFFFYFWRQPTVLFSLQAADEVGFPEFKASKRWLANFKRKNITSRKLTKVVTRIEVQNIDNLKKTAADFAKDV